MIPHEQNPLCLSRRMALRGTRIHFMGIGGIGVSALAEIARSLGAIVSGCDREENEQTARLRGTGVPVEIGHDPAHVRDCDLLVYSSAVPEGHPERRAASRQEKRGSFLARLLDESSAWGVCGTHGKTTTTALTAQILLAAGRDPSVFIGGVADGLGQNYRLGDGPFVAELDESDGSFLLPGLDVAVITNVESDHLSYYKTDEALFAAFRRFADGVAAEGLLVAGLDSPAAAEIFRAHGGRKISFGLTPEADCRAADIQTSPAGSAFTLLLRGRSLGGFSLPLAGRHNVQNALAAAAAALDSGVDEETVRAALAAARGVARRLELLGAVEGAALYSDYAHHPTEVAATIDALRQRHGGRILVVFQPHLYSRTRDYAASFGRALSGADEVVLVDIYPAREEPLAGVDSGLIAATVHGPAVHGPLPLAEVGPAAERLAGGFAAVAFLGAGDIDAAARALARAAPEAVCEPA